MASLKGIRIVPDAKLATYLLNVDHPIGAAKARFFMALGFSLADLGTFETALLLHANAHPVYAERRRNGGINRVIGCNMQTPDGTNPCINAVWTRDDGSTAQRLVTAYPA